jgi:hypothetical protein
MGEEREAEENGGDEREGKETDGCPLTITPTIGSIRFPTSCLCVVMGLPILPLSLPH